MKNKQMSVKVLFLDIETSPLLSYTWGLWDQNVSLNQIHKDWYVLSWSAKWMHDSPNKIMYMDQRNSKDIENDKKILEKIWELIDEADVIVSQNGKKFDIKKLNARFIFHGLTPPSSFKHIDVLQIARKHFGFTSHKLEYMTKKLNKTYKKLDHAKFSGFELWKECLAGNKEAWKEMEVYNKHDILSLEELYNKVIPWDATVNFNIYHDDEITLCKCGSSEFQKRGFFYTSVGKYQRYRCKKCGAETRDRANLFSKEKRASLKVGTNR